MQNDKWIWEGDGKQRGGFEDRSEAIRDAAEFFQLSVEEVRELSRDNIIALGQYTCLKVRPANDND